MNKRYIDMSKGGFEKQKTYKVLNSRRNDSETNGYYIEMISYDYAMIEDRLYSILKHLGIIELKENEYVINESINDELNNIYFEDNSKKHIGPNVSNINTKVKIIEKLFEYSGSNENFQSISYILKLICNELNINELIERQKEWANKRNEIIHGMYNKNINDFDNKVSEIAIEGKELSYGFSQFSDAVKKYVREKQNSLL